MSYAIDRLHTFDLVGGAGSDDGFDVGIHAPSNTVYVVRAGSGDIRLGAWTLKADGTFLVAGSEVLVGHGTRARIVVFDNQRVVVLWLDAQSSLRLRAYVGTDSAGAHVTAETTIATFDVAAVGVTTGVQNPPPNTVVYYAFRQLVFTSVSADGSWKHWLATVSDSAEVSLGPVAQGGPGDKAVVACASFNQLWNNTHPRTAVTLWRNAGQIETRSWRVGYPGVTALATSAQAKPLGTGIVCGTSLSQFHDIFATVAWPGASNATSTMQLISVAADGTMTPYASAEIAEIPETFAPLHGYGSDVATAYKSPLGRLAVAAWRFGAPGTSDPARTVLASKEGTEQPTAMRIASLVPSDASTAVLLVTLDRVAAGALRLVSWRFKKTATLGPIHGRPSATIVTHP